MGTRLLTKEDGERIREWNETGSLLDPNEQLQKRARGAAETGTSEYEAFFSKLTAQQKKFLVSTTHNENKTIAHQADEVEKNAQEDTQEPQQTGQESK